MTTPTERVDTVLAGRFPDRPPFSFWHHFDRDQVSGPAAVQAHLELMERYKPDFLKVMNDNPYPHGGKIKRVEELASLQELDGHEEGFGRQLELLSALRAQVGQRVYLTTTIFNVWMVLRMLLQPPKVHLPPNLDATVDAPSRWIREAYAHRPELVAASLRTIGRNLARFAGKCLTAGADGVFLSVRDDWVDTPQIMATGTSVYAQLVRPTDLAILDAAKAARFNILHVCGKAVDFRAFAQYPVAVLNWADRAAGPAIAQVRDWLKPALCGGVDNLDTLPNGRPEDVAREVEEAVRQAGSRPIIIGPGCTFDPSRVPRANLEAMAEAVRHARYS
jgi:hypothetical protein